MSPAVEQAALRPTISASAAAWARRLRPLRQRITHVVLVLLIVSLGVLLLLELVPGDPVLTILGEGATPAQIVTTRHDLGLDKSLPVRYVDWLGHLASGDAGRSIISGAKVTDMIRERLPVTLELAILSELLALALAVPAAMWAAYRAGGWFDRASNVVVSSFLSVPSFVSALIFVYFLALVLHWFPVTGWVPLTENPVENLRHAFLPAITLATTEAAVFMKVVRGDMIATLREDYIVAARSRGVPTWYLLLRHALRPSSVSLITVASLSLGRVLGGAVVVEYIFALPGIGDLALQAILKKDIPMLQGIVICIAVAYVLLNFAIDGLYARLDPRLRAEGR